MNRGPLAPCLALAMAILLAVPASAAARQDVQRQRFTFPGNQLTIDVQATSPGTLHVARGGIGTIEVAGLTPGGIAAMGLAERGGGRLVLTAHGAQRADYVVMVPPDVMVRVLLPDRPVAESFGSLRSSGSYSWTIEPLPVSAVETAAPNLPAEPVLLPFQYDADTVPARVILAGDHEIGIITVRREGNQFQIGADQPATVLDVADTLEILPDIAMERIVITVPWLVGDFELRSERRGTLLLLEDGAATAVCAPVTEQTLDGRAWYTFSSPAMPGTTCAAPSQATSP